MGDNSKIKYKKGEVTWKNAYEIKWMMNPKFQDNKSLRFIQIEKDLLSTWRKHKICLCMYIKAS
jgi:hypothetical protein